jgi:hypothetical protein
MMSELRAWSYKLSPGDWTTYRFSLLECDPEVDSAVGDGSEYLTLVLHSPGQGSHILRKSDLLNPSMHVVDYIKKGFTEMATRYTLIAVLLACSILVQDRKALDQASQKMLKAGDMV